MPTGITYSATLDMGRETVEFLARLLALAITDRKGNLLWISAARPSRASEITR